MVDTKGRETSGSLSELFEMLSHRYRRRVLVAVAEHDPRDDDISEESVADGQTEGDETLEDVVLQFHHVHLPKLEAAGFIEWDRDSGTITRGPRFEEIEPLLGLIRDRRDELPDDWP